MRNQIFNIPQDTLEKALDEIYEPNHCGIAIIPQAFFPSHLQDILREILQARHFFTAAKEKQGVAEQRFLKRYWGLEENGKDKDHILPLASNFSERYSKIMNPLLVKRKLTQPNVTSVGVHIYPEEDQNGLDPHRDLSNIQLVSSIVLAGYAPLYTAEDHSLKISPQIFKPRPLSLTLMRGPRNEEERYKSNPNSSNYNNEEDLRPIHCIGPVEKERTVILLRHAIKNQK